MSVTSMIFKFFLGIYKILPLKKQLCQLVRATGIPNKKFYKDMKFEGEFEVQVTSEARFKLYHHNSTIENEIFWKGLGKSWEEDTVWIIAELAKTSDVIFDIGANTGVYSLLSKSLNPKAKIYAFEPVQRTFKRLEQNIAINNFDVTTEQIALSDKSGKQIFYDTYAEHQQSSSLSPDKLKNTSWNTEKIVEYEIETITIDDYISKKGIQKIDLMKIDVEMHEPEVIEGFKKHLALFQPYIIIEVLETVIADKLNTVFANGGYKIFHLDEVNVLIEKNKIELVPDKWNYLVCTPAKAEKLQKFIKK